MMIGTARRTGLSYSRTVVQLVIPGDPVPKARPRLGARGYTYTPRRTAEAEQRLVGYLKASYPALRPVEGQFSVSVDYHFRGAPRCDLDNLLKLVLDAFNRRVWPDDAAVMQVWARKHLHSPAPRTEITVHQLHEANS